MRKIANSSVPRGTALILALMLFLAGPSSGIGPTARADSQDKESAMTGPAVVELFTSQGCNSCPPADELLVELAARPDVVALSLHVDYWDYIGWKDPFGSPLNTERQQRYAESLGLRYVFTPQIVVDGRTSVIGSRRDEVMAAIDVAVERARALEISFESRNGGTVIVPAGHAPESGATIWLAVYDISHETEIGRGENSGRTLRNANVVRRFERLGTWTGERLEIPLDLAAAAARGRDGCAVIVQEGRTGPILGAAAVPLDRLF